MSSALTPQARSLAITGAALFIAGLLQGAVVDQFANPRMALSAHLDAVQSGMAVMIAALFWHHAVLGTAAERVSRWTLAIGMVGLWVALTLSAMTGASQSLPMAGAGYAAEPTAEAIVSALVLASSGAIVIGWGLFLVGLIRRP